MHGRRTGPQARPVRCAQQLQDEREVHDQESSWTNRPHDTRNQLGGGVCRELGGARHRARARAGQKSVLLERVLALAMDLPVRPGGEQAQLGLQYTDV